MRLIHGSHFLNGERTDGPLRPKESGVARIAKAVIFWQIVKQIPMNAAGFSGIAAIGYADGCLNWTLYRLVAGVPLRGMWAPSNTGVVAVR